MSILLTWTVYSAPLILVLSGGATDWRTWSICNHNKSHKGAIVLVGQTELMLQHFHLLKASARECSYFNCNSFILHNIINIYLFWNGCCSVFMCYLCDIKSDHMVSFHLCHYATMTTSGVRSIKASSLIVLLRVIK